MTTDDKTNWNKLRAAMVKNQINARGIADAKVLAAILQTPRHEFLPEAERTAAYEDTPLPIGRGQTISQPYMVALMTEALKLNGGEKVLDVGTGSGYQAAILAEMGCKIHSIERDPIIAKKAEETLTRLGCDDVKVHVGDGTLGLLEEAPFHRIIVTAGGPKIPDQLKAQLHPNGGILVIPVGQKAFQELKRITRSKDEFKIENLGACCFVPLIGEEGWR